MTNLGELASGPPLEAAIIGGGINGAAIAREMASRGMRVALFEKDDFGFGTTWRSTKLIHGGLRYLEHGDVRLVLESLRERKWLLRTRPHLVQPLRFLLPTLPWTRRPAWQVGLGLTIYDVLAAGGGLPFHRRVSTKRASELAPGIRENSGGFTFYDARALAPERLALELALEARAMGAAVFNHTSVTALDCQAGKVVGIAVEAGGALWRVSTKRVINAGGPWVDAVARLAEPEATAILGVTRGTHLVLEPEVLPTRAAVLSTARSDGRVFFAIPQGRLLLVGTTDERFEREPGSVAPTRHEVDYLLEEAQELFPAAGLGKKQVRYAYAGLRPLIRGKEGPAAAISRRHDVLDHGERGGPGGLYSVVGGKLSTFRPLAREAADKVDRRRQTRAPLTRLPRHAFAGPSRNLRIYGPAAGEVAALGEDLICEHEGVTVGQVRHAIKNEMATTLSDIMLRRTGLGWTAGRGLCCAKDVASLAARDLGWGTEERAAQLEKFHEDVRRNLPNVDEVLT